MLMKVCWPWWLVGKEANVEWVEGPLFGKNLQLGASEGPLVIYESYIFSFKILVCFGSVEWAY